MLVASNKSLSNVKGLSHKIISQMNKLGIKSIRDCLNICPFKYEFVLSKHRIPLHDGHLETVCGKKISTVTPKRCKDGKYLLRFRLQLSSHTQTVLVNIFSKMNYQDYLNSHDYYVVYGKYNSKWNNITVYNLSLLVNQSSTIDNMLGVYHSKYGIKQKLIRRAIHYTYNQYSWCIQDILPESIRHKNGLLHRKQSLKELQKPTELRLFKLARKTEIYTEFYVFLSKLKKIQSTQKHKMGLSFTYSKRLLESFEKALPYKLTSDQYHAIKEILNDLHNRYQMNRLLQGDVGSGKTVVAMFAILATISAGYQCALMAPTSILTLQHFHTFVNAFRGLGVKTAVLTGSMSEPNKKQVINKISNGQISLVIGTESLFQENINYNALGLIVIDEQHRFGVQQRLQLAKKEIGVNILSMTATPIPRTLSLMNYGDMSKSILRHGPKGRKPIHTEWIHKNNIQVLLEYMLHVLKKHQQIYVVAPLITKSNNNMSTSDVMDLYKKINSILDNQYRIGVLNGKMDAHTIKAVMKKFKSGYYSILISTTVIEVGVNISNATLMVIYDADHFGLAQLHQLRGRVGRSNKQSYCLLVSNPSTKNGYKRMEIMEHTNSGFQIAKDDLALRDAGNIFGEKQSGLPDFQIANPIKDINILKKVQIDLHLS